ncbi:hypothetical protein THIAE_04750 [Thiomicrospira aerophila AL3]|uniref:STAS domain-containing protein n=1 Tax=Thiomicrospira aerophila AL3 TaxID=717772 RepID=W0DZH0_9GAMM|nr:STAS domain-containing protein [Thiomicrospira aerophila]AHF02241.1 hypothetical protein THIAE_04750 [Thiomicrospira aerophila AL3]
MSSVISLPETLTIQSVQSEYARITDLLVDCEPNITLVADNIINIDTAGLQLLLALITKIQREGFNFSWQDPAEPLIKSAENLGLTDALQL